MAIFQKGTKFKKGTKQVEPELVRGFFERIEYSDGILSFSGWCFLMDKYFDDFHVKINGITVGKAQQIERGDVQQVFSSIPTALKSGFIFYAPVQEEKLRDWVDIDVIGLQKGTEIAKINTIFRSDYIISLPEPPIKLRERVANIQDLHAYYCSGLKSFGEFFKVIQKYCDLSVTKKLLDWGCGCGRVTQFFLKYLKIPEIYGCDIDKEAIDWCKEHLQSGHFITIDPYPPTHFGNNMFDVIISYSVFTHLERDAQIQWLKEIKRILIPGGFFFATVHGDFAASFAPPNVQKEMIQSGISDSSSDPNLDGIAPAEYYRGVYQTKTYTLREWGKHFRVIDYIEGGIGNFQDLVIMQKGK